VESWQNKRKLQENLNYMLALSIKLGCPTDDIEILLEEGADADAVAIGTTDSSHFRF